MKFVKLIRSSLLLSLVTSSSIVLAQNTGSITVGTESQPREGKDFTITAAPSNPTVTFSKVTIGYRLPNDEYTETEMRFEKGIWKYLISGEFSVPPRIDYFIIATQSDGSEVTYPAENYRQNPAFLSISPKGLTDEITVMMGEDGSKSSPEDFMIMISYYALSDQIDVNSVKLTLNGVDVTKESSVTADALNYLPSTPPKGKQSVNFEAKLLDGTPVGPLRWSVSIVSKDEAKAEEEAEQNYSLSGNVWDEYRYEKTSYQTKGVNRANATASGNIHWLTYNVNLYKSSEESKFKQTSDRYTLKLGTEYLDLTFGDAFPSFSRLMMNGSRVRGVEANLKSDYINLDIAYGTLQRATDVQFDGAPVIILTSDTLAIATKVGEGYTVINKNAVNTTLRKISSNGSYDRNLISAKLSFGSKKQGFNWGLGFLRSIDDTTTNKYGDSPSANLVLSTDAQLRYDNGRFELYSDAAFSINNTDMQNKNELVEKEAKKTLGSSYDLVNSIIPISASLGAPAKPNQIMNYMALMAGLKLNYWNNYFKAEYIRNGSTYKSEGLPFFQKDIQGFKINDRLRLFQNKLFLTAGYDLLFDNTDGNKDLPLSINGKQQTFDGTTTRNNIRSGIAIFPGANIPSLSFDYIRLTSINEIPETETASQNNASNTFQISTNYGFSWLSGYHTVGIAFSMTEKKDQRDEDIYLSKYALASTNQTVRSVVLSYGTTVGNDLSLNLSYNNSGSTYREVNITGPTKGVSGYGTYKDAETSFNIIEGSVGKGFLDNKLRTQGRANLTISDNNQYIFGGNAQYYFFSNFFATSDANFILNEGADSDLLFTLRLQYVF